MLAQYYSVCSDLLSEQWFNSFSYNPKKYNMHNKIKTAYLTHVSICLVTFIKRIFLFSQKNLVPLYSINSLFHSGVYISALTSFFYSLHFSIIYSKSGSNSSGFSHGMLSSLIYNSVVFSIVSMCLRA